MGAVQTGLFLAVSLAACASLVARFRRARGVERQQLKWFAHAASLMVIPFVVWEPLLPVNWRRGCGAHHCPASGGGRHRHLALSAVRHRPADNRTLVYGLLTALLAGVYAGAVLVLGQLTPNARHPRIAAVEGHVCSGI
jgi:hypothetical protein